MKLELTKKQKRKLMSNEEKTKLICKDVKTYFKKKNEKINFDKKIEEGDQDWLDLINKDEADSSIKIRIYPTKDQKHTLNKWFGVRRYIYNKCLSSIKKNECNENFFFTLDSISGVFSMCK